MTAGYSGTPLAKKLGLKPGMRNFTIAKDPACTGCGSAA